MGLHVHDEVKFPTKFGSELAPKEPRRHCNVFSPIFWATVKEATGGNRTLMYSDSDSRDDRSRDGVRSCHSDGDRNDASHDLFQTLDEGLGQSSSLRQSPANSRTGSGPVSSSLRRGPAGSRTFGSVSMYSTPAVECVRLLVVMQFGKTKRDRRRYDQRLYGALPLSYGPGIVLRPES